MLEEKNAVIKSTMLGVEDHEVMTFWLYLDYGGSEQGYGGFSLDEYDGEKKQRVSTIFGLRAIMEVLRVTGAGSWERLPGTPVRVQIGHTGSIESLGHYLEDKWFNFREVALD